MDVGNRIRELRKRSGFSMKQLAEKVGVSYLTIYRIETGKVSPSVTLLNDIASHLNYPIFSFFDQKAKEIVHIKANKQPVIASEKLQLKLLAPRGFIDDNIAISFGKAEKGEFISKHTNRGAELAYVTKGKGIVKYGDTEYELKEGDLIYFQGETPHTVVALEPHEFIIIHFIDK
jgi:transcriptional regulator with XRE-family HTH domain